METNATFDVLLAKRDSVEAALTALAKRLERKHLTPLSWSWGKAFVEKTYENGTEKKTPRVPLTLVGETPRYAGWKFLAALEHMDGENVTRTVPGETLPTEYRTRGPVCDHCQAARRRNETYVLRHEDGRTVQVGSTCIADFLGSNDALKIAAQATYWALASDIGLDGCEGEGGGGSSLMLSWYLPMVAAVIRVQGFVSRTVARDQGGMATADRALVFLEPRGGLAKALAAGIAVTSDDETLAAAAESWAENLSDEAVNSEKSDYLHNLRVIARNGVVGHKTFGLAASIIVAYQNFLGRERRKAERAARPNNNAHVGTVGKREVFKGLTLDFVTGYETDFGYTTVLKFKTATGETIVWKASNTALGRDDVGKVFDVKGTVKKHDEYKGQKQTLLSRCVVTEVATPA